MHATILNTTERNGFRNESHNRLPNHFAIIIEFVSIYNANLPEMQRITQLLN